jgi:hypothetical protein
MQMEGIMDSNSKSLHSGIVRIFIAVVLTALFSASAVAGERSPHNPYTVLGVQLRTHLAPTTPGANGESMGPLVFQEIVPCRFVSTLEADDYDDPWGGDAFVNHESRTYFPKGYLVSARGWENPCSKQVPSEAVAVSLRLMAHAPDNPGAVFLSPSTFNALGQAALEFAAKADEMEEATVVLRNDGFAISTTEAADLTIDITGYFLRDDPNAYGGKGEQGDRGEKGERGEQGLQGERGEQGLQGERGEQGLQGERGEQGLQGERGEQGLQGERGEQGLQGERGEQGLQGERGEQGLQGERGEQGLQGERGEQGLQGERGEQGLQGERGEQGLQGERGEKGEKGEAGEKGEKGETGPQGPQGLRGPAGPVALMASTGGSVFPPPGQIKIYDGAVKANSFIMVQYSEYTHGNAIGVASQGDGWFVADGSPNKPFQYVVLTPQ